jgi:hypothetical protein
MIRDFILDDWFNFNPNEFSKLEDISIFNDKDYYFYTLENNGIKSIICFANIGNDEYLAFFLISNEFTNNNAKELKRFMLECINKTNAKRVFTVSKQCEVIRKWHEFLGLRIEKEVTVNDIKYDMWVI